MQVGEWNFEIVQVRCRKVENYGDAYKAVASISIVDGEAHVEGLLSTVGFSKEDKKDIANYLISIGYNYYVSSYFIGDKRITRKIKI